jgi:exonuclease VII large subunit
MVAHTRCKTPTAVAAFLIDKMAETETDLIFLQNKISDNVSEYIENKKKHLENIILSFLQKLNLSLQKEKQKIREKLYCIKI